MKKLILLSILVFAVSLVYAQWQDDVRLTNDPFSSLNYSQNSIVSSGDSVHVVWYDYRDGNAEIYYKRSTDGGLTWGEDIRLTNRPGNSVNASIAISGSVLHVLWMDDGDGNYELYYKRSEDGGNSWGEDMRITNTPGSTSSSGISVSGPMAHLTYHDNSDGNWEIYYKRSTDDGVTWEPDVRLTNNQTISLNPKFYANGSVLHVVWDDSRNGNKEIYYKRSADNGLTWGLDVRLTNNDSKSLLPCVGASGSDVYVVWDDNRDGNSELYFKRSADGGLTWEADTRLTINSGDSKYPNFAISGTSLFVVWVDNSDGNTEIYYKHSTDKGMNWDPDNRLTDDIAESNYPIVSVSGSQINLTWYDSRDGNYEIYYKRDPIGGFPVGIDNELDDNSRQPITIYPNPASTTLNISFISPSGENITLRLWDMRGQTFRVYNFTAVEGINQYTIALDDFCNGFYFIGLTTGSQNYYRKIIIKK